MRATEPRGFMYLNTANQWPSFTLQDMSIDASGGMALNTSGGKYAIAGVFMGGPFQALDGDTPWRRFELFDSDLPPGTHLQVFTWTAETGVPPFSPGSTAPFPGWAAAPRDSLNGMIFNAPARRLWIGGVVRSDGTATPVIRQIRVDYGPGAYLQHLPAIYRSDAAASDLVDRILSLSGTALGGLRREIVHLTRLFDPAAAPDDGYPSWLAWLSGWLAWNLDRNWTDAQTREYIARAFQLYGLRGTVEGLRRYLKIYAGVNAHITEPGQSATVWSLGANSTLGFSTMLAPATGAGAVLDSTAVLDASDLTGPDDPFGSALLDAVANRFCIEINAAELARPGAMEAVRAVIAREKPAHTVCGLCIMQPRMRVGSQCRIGIDTVVAAPRQAQIGTLLDHVVLAAHDHECDEKEVSHAA
jgi:phage tail-like protein